LSRKSIDISNAEVYFFENIYALGGVVMIFRKDVIVSTICTGFVFVLLLTPLIASAQTDNTIMPMGNSITWGKVDRAAPPAGTHGYRDELFNRLVGNSINFVGPQPGNGYYNGAYDDGPYEGYFRDAATIGQFLPDSVYDVNSMMLQMSIDSIPQTVILHIGTNNMYTEVPIGDYTTPGTVANQLYELVNILLDFSVSGHRVENLLLCKIIPYSPYLDFPSRNQRVQDYNSALVTMVDNLPASKQERITVIDMFSPFLANEYTYYNFDIDHTHPNLTGYAAMAEIFYHYISQILVPSFRDDLIGSGALDGYNRWHADPTLRLYTNDHVYCNENVTDNWEHLGIWAKSEDANAVTMGISNEAFVGNYASVAMAIALNDTDATTANGYMVWISGSKLRIYTIENGQSGVNALFGADYLDVTNYGMEQYGPGDSLRVQYREAETSNWFDIQVNDGPSITVRHNTSTWGKERFWGHFYSGFIFRGQSGVPPNNPSAMVDFIKVETQLPDIVAPGTIDDLDVFARSHDSVTLTWTATGNDGEIGQASSYDLRMSTSPISTSNFENAEIVTGISTPLNTGTPETFKITGLLSGVHYYFRIRAVDNWGNTGAASNLADAVTERGGESHEDFEGDLSNWVFDPVEYGFDPRFPGEFTDLQGSLGWANSVAVYTARTNPTTVKLVWGESVYDNQAILGGPAVMLNDDDYDASGYFIWLRHSPNIPNSTPILYLWHLENGYANTDGVADAVPFTIKDGTGDYIIPAKEDTMIIVMDWSNPAYNKFEVYINNEPAGERALYDETKRISGSGTMYSGVYLNRLYTVSGRNNNISDFYTAGPLSAYPVPQVMGSAVFEGTVDETLPETIKMYVTDTNSNPLPNWPVYFDVTQDQTGGSVTAPEVVHDPIRIEAEWGQIKTESGGSMEKISHPTASRGYYIVSPGGSHHTSWVEFKFSVPEQGEYYFWGRGVARNQYQSIVWFELDGVPDEGFAWEVNRNNYSSTDYDWKWSRVVEFGQTTAWKRELTATEHTLRIYKGHNNVKLDKIIVTRNGAYQPSGMDTVATLFTDANAEAETEWTLGQTAGQNIVKAWTFGNNAKLTYTATGKAAYPNAIYKLAGDGGTGAARDTIATPLVVRLEDPYANPTPGIPVYWEVVGNNGGVTVAEDTTDANGEASTQMILGIADAVTQVKATFTGYAGIDKIFSGTATSGLVEKIQIHSGTGAGQRHFTDMTYPNLLKVRILDDQDDPVDDVPVYFGIGAGAQYGSVGQQPKMTDAGGFVQDTVFYNSEAGIVKITATVGSLVDTILVDSVFYHGARLQYWGGPQQGTILDTLQYRLKVRVLNASNVPVEGHPVNFMTNAEGFYFPGGGSTREVLTNSSGIANTNVMLPAVHGPYQNVVSAWSTDGFKFIPDSIHWTIHAKSSAAFLKKIQGDSLEGVVNELLNVPIKVQMLDNSEVGVFGQPVDFVIKSGGGQFQGTTSDTIRQYTAGEGYAQVNFIMGPYAGAYNNIIEVHATNGVSPLTNYKTRLTEPVVFRLSAKSSDAYAMTAYQVGDTVFTGTAGKTLTNPVQVQVTDQFGNPVDQGASVTYTIMSGGGTLNGTSSTSKTIAIDNAGGIASVNWEMGPVAGSMNNRLKAEASNGLISLNGSPVNFYASAVPDVVSDTVSVITATSPVKADGQDTSWVTVTLMDQHTNTVSGKRIDLSVSGSGINYVFDPTLPTDADGIARGFMLSQSAGNKTVTAKVIDDGITLKQTAMVQFTANSAAKIKVSSGDEQTANVGTVVPNSMIVKVTDINNNPVIYPVTFECITEGGSILEPQPVVSGEDGFASSHLVLGPSVKSYVVKVSAEKDSEPLENSPLYFSADGKTGTAAIMDYAPGFPQQQSASAGESLPQPFVVVVTDITGAPVYGASITFTVQQGNALPATQVVTTDMYGYARGYFTADVNVGIKNLILATNNSLSGSPKLFEVTSSAGTARKIAAYSGDNQSGYIGGPLTNPLTVQITDAHGNPSEGVSVEFDIISGDATIGGAQTATVSSGSNGLASVILTLGNTTGTVKVEATSQYLEGSPVTFTAHATTIQATSIQKITPDQKGTLGQLLADPLRVQVFDAYNNPVPGVSVNFFKASGEGSVESAQPAFSDDRGIAEAYFKAGNTPGFSVVKAVLGVGKEVSFNIESVINSNFPALDKSLIPSTVDVFESERMTPVVLTGSDMDGDALSFDIADPFPPDGMTVESQSASTALLEWTPDYDQAGQYWVEVRILDGKGGFDSDSIFIEVKNVNRPPVIVETIPQALDTTVSAGQTMIFWVNASDLDEDDLQYTWEVNGEAVADNNLPVFYYDVPRFPTSVVLRNVTVYVSDGSIVVSHEWGLVIETSVELSEFTGMFDQKKHQIQIVWSTSRQTSNAGFYVSRSLSEDGEYTWLNEDIIPKQDQSEYRFVDRDVKVGQRYYYKLVDVDINGYETEHGPVMVEAPRPRVYKLHQNYPNPFNPVTKIQFELPAKEHTILTIYNLMGQRVVTLTDQEHDAGYYIYEWDGLDYTGKQVSTGVYIYRLKTDSQVMTKRMVKMK